MGRGDATFGPDALRRRLPDIPATGRFAVALSGGADSTGLAVALAELAPGFDNAPVALHVHHGVHPDADAWAEHCREVCDRIGLAFRSLEVSPDPDSTLGPEAEWRERRYEALAGAVGPDDILLTAHHLEDQAETVLLHLLRGSGPEGLAGIPSARALGEARVERPLLDVPRDALERYLAERDIPWIEDSGNDDTTLDRNFLRHRVMPVLRQRWPSADASLARSARYQAEAAATIRAAAGERLGGLTRGGRVLPLAGLRADPVIGLKPVLREWIRQRGLPGIPAARLESFVDQLVDADATSSAALTWEGHRLRLYRDALWLDRGDDARPFSFEWHDGALIDLGPVAGTLSLSGEVSVMDRGHWTVRSRRGGERFRPAPDRPGRPVKDLLREAGVPPWLRAAVPLLIDEDEILAIGDWLVTETLARRLRDRDAKLRWRPGHRLLDDIHRNTLAGAGEVESGPALG